MLCDKCHHNEATIHIREMRNNQWTTVNLCAECAGKLENEGALGQLGFNLAEMLLKLGQNADKKPEESAPKPPDFPPCPNCRWTVAKINETGGKLGCPECYRHFMPLLEGVFSRVQRGAVHIGKRPDPAGPAGVKALQFELDKLNKELKTAILREEYERAATCRDRIKKLRQLMRQKSSGATSQS